MQELQNLAETAKSQLKINFDAEGVKFLEGFIERTKTQIPPDQWSGLITTCGAFLGRAIIATYGGYWLSLDDGNLAIAFNEENMVFPFAKVSKQFENGLEDSIYSLFTLIPTVFKIVPKPKKKWWRF